jgi:dTDP-4-amino-4,6-dideoxygalactose transaminase
LKDVDGIILPKVHSYTRHSYHIYPILLDTEKLSITREKFIDKLREYNIGTSVHFIPLHLQPYYQKTYGYNRGDFPVAEYLFDREVSLPFFPLMKDEDVKYVAEVIKEILNDRRIRGIKNG